MNLDLKPESWENIFSCLRDKDTVIIARSNFWASIQHLEEQHDRLRKEGQGDNPQV
jgi:hypothetical protein